MNNISYHTDQKNMIFRYFERNNDRQISASEIKEELAAANQKIGLATIYRHLDSLENRALSGNSPMKAEKNLAGNMPAVMKTAPVITI